MTRRSSPTRKEMEAGLALAIGGLHKLIIASKGNVPTDNLVPIMRDIVNLYESLEMERSARAGFDAYAVRGVTMVNPAAFRRLSRWERLVMWLRSVRRYFEMER